MTRYCPYCGEEAGGIKVAEDDWIDYCHECDVIIEGQTVFLDFIRSEEDEAPR